MKKAVYFISILIIFILVLGLSACNLDFSEVFDDISKNHTFSEDGLQEISNVYICNDSADFAGSVEWRAVIEEDNIQTNLDIKIVSQKIEETKKVAVIVKKDGITYRSLTIGGQRWVINENEATYYTSVGPEDISVFMPAAKAIGCAFLPMVDEAGDPLWQLVEKRDAKIADKDDGLVDTKEYEFCGTVDENDKFIINFALKTTSGSLAPPPVKMYFETNDNDSVSKITIYFLQLPSEKLELSAFAIPSASTGYLDID